MPAAPSTVTGDVWGSPLLEWLEVSIDPTTGELTSDAIDQITAAVAPLMPDYEFGYNETAIGGGTLFTATTESGANEILAVTCNTDGGDVDVYFDPRNLYMETSANATMRIGLWIDNVYKELLVAQNAATASFHVNEYAGTSRVRVTGLSAGSHVFSVRGWVSVTTGGPGVGGGFGDGDAAAVALYVRKVVGA